MINNNRMRSVIGSICSSCFGVAVIFAFIYIIVQKRETIISILDISISGILLLVIGVILTLFVNSTQTFLLLRAEGKIIGYWENFMLLTASMMANYLPMKVGTIIRMRYLKAVYGLRYARFGSLMGIRVVILVYATGVLGIVGTVGLWISEYFLSIELIVIFGSLLIISILATFVSKLKFKNHKNFFLRTWTDFSQGFELIKNNAFLTLQIIILTLLYFCILGFRIYLTFDMIHIQLSPWVLLVIAPVTALMTFLSITPGSMGIKEAVIGALAMATGYNFESGLFAGTFDRAIFLAVLFFLGTSGIIYVWIRLRRAEADKKENQTRVISSKEESMLYNVLVSK